MKNSTVYQTIISPLLPLLKAEAAQLKDDDYKLSLQFFTLNLCYCIIAGLRSIRLLITEIKTSENTQELELVTASSSMYSEAFLRYEPDIFKRIFFGLLDKLEFKSIPEINSLGRFILMDGSIFPAIKTMNWASYKKTANGIKLHLAFELNRMIPVQFLSTDANGSEKKILEALLEKGVTYIADRGYIAFDLFRQIANQSAFFIIRVKSNMGFVATEALTVDVPDHWKAHLNSVTDSLVVFTGDKHSKSYRMITFEALGECYQIATNRLDLKTSEIIMLYAYRWQIELFFRCIKRCFTSLHLWSHEPKGIEIQFYLYMIVYLLLLNFKQRIHDDVPEEGSNAETSDKGHEMTCVKRELNKAPERGAARTPACGIVTLLGDQLKKLWKIGIHWLTAIRNMLTKPITPERIKVLNTI